MAQKYTLSGYISDSTSGEQLLGASVYISELKDGTASNLYGFYSITLPAGKYNVVYSYVGYKSKQLTINLSENTSLNMELGSVNVLNEVEITAERSNQIQEKTQMSTISISMDKVKTLPSFMGEQDVIKTLQLLPGVQSGGEGGSGLYVRGGGPDQNLILLDGVPVYNASHLFGFFSVFNADAINSVELMKGGFPARYGGRLSSVLDIRMKEGNLNEFHGEGSIGIISSKLSLEGPIIKGKTSFIVSGRRTYIDILSRPLIKAAAQQQGGSDVVAGYYFYDLNGKINQALNQLVKLFVINILDTKYNFGNSLFGNEILGQYLWAINVDAIDQLTYFFLVLIYVTYHLYIAFGMVGQGSMGQNPRISGTIDHHVFGRIESILLNKSMKKRFKNIPRGYQGYKRNKAVYYYDGQWNGKIVCQLKFPVCKYQENSKDTCQANSVEDIIHIPHTCMPHNSFVRANH